MLIKNMLKMLIKNMFNILLILWVEKIFEKP